MNNLFQQIAKALFGRFSSESNMPLTYRCSSSGATVQFQKAPFVHQSYNETGDEYFTGQSVEGPATYGFVSCRMQQSSSDLMIAEQRLFLFMEELHPHFGIRCTTGLDHGLPYLHGHEAIGMSEYWQDEEGDDWKVVAWTDGTQMTVLYIKNISITDFRRQDAFFDSFRFAPAMKLA